MALHLTKEGVTGSEKSFLMLQLRKNLRDYEELTRKNSGSNKGGIRVAHGDPYYYAKYALNTTLKYLFRLKSEHPDQYCSILSGEQGEFIPVVFSTTRYAELNQHDALEREDFKHSKTIKRRPNGKAQAVQNSERSLFNWRHKLALSSVQQHANGATSPGFDMFREWTGINQQGVPDKKGRCGVIGYFNLKYALGPGWMANNDQLTPHSAENQPVEEQKNIGLPEDFSATLSIKKIENKKKKGEVAFSEMSAEPDKQRGIEKPEDQRGVTNRPSERETFAEKKEEQTSRRPGSLSPTPQRPAEQLWDLLLFKVYLPRLKSGQVRYNAENSCERTSFSEAVKRKGIAALEILLKQYQVQTLKLAIEKQAQWLEDETHWIYTPGTFLRPDLVRGGIVSAIRELVRPGKVEKSPTEMDASLPENECLRQLYDQVINLGCSKIRIHTWEKWSRKHGLEYLTEVVKIFRSEITKRREKGAEPGKEFKHGYSEKLSKLVYYGKELVTENTEKNAAKMKDIVRAQVNDEKWKPIFQEVAQLSGKHKTVLIDLCKEHLNVNFKGAKPGIIYMPLNFILLAWCYENYLKPTLPQPGIGNPV